MGSTSSLAVDSANRATDGNLVPSTTVPIAPSTATSALGAVVKLVPTDVVGMYVVVLTALQAGSEIDKSAPQLWAWFGIALVLTVVFFYLQFAQTYKHQTDRMPSWKQIPAWRICLTVIAFIVWAFASKPDATAVMFAPYGQHAALIAALAIVVVGPLLAAVDGLLNPMKPDSANLTASSQPALAS